MKNKEEEEVMICSMFSKHDAVVTGWPGCGPHASRCGTSICVLVSFSFCSRGSALLEEGCADWLEASLA